MARVTGPLLSMDASGAVGGAVVFAKWKGRNYVRRFVVPHNPRSALQQAQRAVMRFLSTEWGGLSAPNKASWDALAEATNISPFNAFVSNGLDRNSMVKAPAMEYPAPETGVAPSPPTIVATGGVHNAHLVITEGTSPTEWGWWIYRKLGAAPTGLVSELIAVKGTAGGTTPYSDAPLVAGTYHYKIKGGSDTGLFGTLSVADTTAVVT